MVLTFFEVHSFFYIHNITINQKNQVPLYAAYPDVLLPRSISVRLFSQDYPQNYSYLIYLFRLYLYSCTHQAAAGLLLAD